MADSVLDQVAQAIHDTLWATGEFKSGSPEARLEVGSTPSFMVWWDRFRRTTPEVSAGSNLAEVTHTFLIDLHVMVDGDARGAQRKIRTLAQTVVQALDDNHRLGGKCLSSRVVAGEVQEEDKGNNRFLVMPVAFEVDRFRW